MFYSYQPSQNALSCIYQEEFPTTIVLTIGPINQYLVDLDSSKTSTKSVCHCVTIPFTSIFTLNITITKDPAPIHIVHYWSQFSKAILQHHPLSMKCLDPICQLAISLHIHMPTQKPCGNHYPICFQICSLTVCFKPSPFWKKTCPTHLL